MKGFLLVESTRRFGLPVHDTLEVVEPVHYDPVLGMDKAVRGITTWRGRPLPVTHLSALVDGVACPETVSTTMVVVGRHTTPVGLEVEDVFEVTHSAMRPMQGPPSPWLLGMIRVDDVLVSIVDTEAVVAQMLGTREHDQ